MNNPSILVTIAARGGSKGVKNKNIRSLCGKPLLAHTILQAKRWGKAQKIICSTDSSKIAATAKRYGAEVPFVRPKNLSGDKVGKLPVLRHALKTAEKYYGRKFSLVVDLDATAPIRELSDIDGAVKLFLQKKPKCIFSVVSCRKNPYFNVIELNRYGYAEICKKPIKPILRRQDAPKVYDANASIYVYDRNFLLDEKTMTVISDKTMVWVMDEMSAFDIDTELDFQFIEFLVLKKLVRL